MTDMIFLTDGEERFCIPSPFSNNYYFGTKCPETKLEIKKMTDMIFSTDGEEKFRIPFPAPEIITPTHKLEIKKMNEIQKTEGEIKILQAKLELLKEMENYKSSAEKAFYRVYGEYPPTTPNVSNYEDNRWSAFQNGYNASKEECKVEKEPKPKPETLYQMFYDEKWSKRVCDDICKVVEEWMSQYTCETNKWDEDYKCGFLDCLDVLRKNLK